MDEDLRNALIDLLDYFEMGEGWNGEWAECAIYQAGSFYRGVVDDPLYQVLMDIRELVEADNE